MVKSKAATYSLLAGLILIVIIGWSSFRGKMYDFDNTEVIQQIEMFDLPYETKIPSEVPLVEMNLYESKYENEQVTVTLINRDKDALDIRISENSFNYKADLEQENIVIGKEKQGFFIPNDSGKRILYWNDEGVNYEITYYSKLTPKEISKKQFVKMAESFK